jgi:plasmid maintenance system antidote protein VapI
MEMNRIGFTGLDAGVAAEVRSEIARSRTASVKGLAEKLGIRRATLSSRVNGHAAFTPSLLAAVAAELGTTASSIIARAERAIDSAEAVAS